MTQPDQVPYCSLTRLLFRIFIQGSGCTAALPAGPP